VNKNEILEQKVVFLTILMIKKILSRKWTLQTLSIYSQSCKNHKCIVLRTYLQF